MYSFAPALPGPSKQSSQLAMLWQNSLRQFTLDLAANTLAVGASFGDSSPGGDTGAHTIRPHRHYLDPAG